MTAQDLYLYLKDNLIGRVVQGHLTHIVTEDEMDRLYEEFVTSKQKEL